MLSQKLLSKKETFFVTRLFLTLFLFSTSFSKIITVNGNGGADFTTIQEAVNYASNNDTVSVLPGTYVECIDLSNKSLTLIGTSRENTIIKCKNAYSYAIIGQNVYVIKNLTITSDVLSLGIWLMAATVENNVIKNMNNGITVDSGFIANNVIENNNSGISIRTGQITNNIIKINNDGIYLQIDPRLNNKLIIKNNEITENGSGIKSLGCPDYIDSTIVIIGNTIYNNAYGIYYERPIPIQKSSGKVDSVENYRIDARWNWWGTVVVDTIAKYIFDHNDFGDNTAIVDFSEWLIKQNNTQDSTDTIGIHYNNIFNNSVFNLYALIPLANSVESNDQGINESFLLHQNYPNPFNPCTVISYQLSVNSYVVLKIIDVLGREIATLVNENKHPGSYTVEWNASNFPSGVYFYKLQSVNNVSVKKMLFLR